MKDQLRDYSLNKPSLICRSHILANATGFILVLAFFSQIEQSCDHSAKLCHGRMGRGGHGLP
jgi:hypothetical protein